MQQVVVPQFLDVEDKIIGAITVRQFLEMLIAGIIIAVFYRLFDFSLFVVSSLAVFSLTVVIAFARINGQPFHLFMLNFIQTMRSPKLKTWKKDFTSADTRVKKGEIAEEKAAVIYRKPLATSKISEIALIIDTGGIYSGENGISK